MSVRDQKAAIESLQAEVERLREVNDGLYLAVQMAQKRQEKLQAALQEIADLDMTPEVAHVGGIAWEALRE